MARKIEIDSWVDKKDSLITINKMEWVNEYIDKNKLDNYRDIIRGPINNAESVKDRLQHMLNSGLTDDIKKLKAAWSREKYRNKNQSNTFALSKESHKELRRLVTERNSSIKKTIEELINGNFLEIIKIKKEEATKRAKERSYKKQQKNQPFPTNLNLLQPNKFIQKEQKKLNDKIEEQEKIINSLKLRVFEYQIFLEDLILENDLANELLALELTAKQKSKSKELFNKNVTTSKIP